jgi:hypothetical protein
LNFDRIKLELFCPWWLPHGCHITTMLDHWMQASITL